MVVFHGKRYWVSALNVVLQIMKTIIRAVFPQEEMVEKAISMYLNDIYINKDVSLALHIQVKLAQFGLDCMAPCILSLDVSGDEGLVQWKRESVVPGISEVLTKGTIFSLCGKLVGHLPMCGWLHAAVGIIKRRVNAVTSRRDDQTSDALRTRMIAESVERAT